MYNKSTMHAMICIYSVQPYISKYISINITMTTYDTCVIHTMKLNIHELWLETLHHNCRHIYLANMHLLC